MEAQLGTTNLLLGIMAAVSLLQALLLIGAGIAGWTLYQRVTALMADLEQRHVAPVMSTVNAILDDVRGVTSTVKEETNRVDYALRSTIHRVDDTADRVRFQRSSENEPRRRVRTRRPRRDRDDAASGGVARYSQPGGETWETDTIASTTRVAAVAAS
jgi:hypothetical protein